MATTITYSENGISTVYTLSADMVAGLEALRVSGWKASATGMPSVGLTPYASVPELLVDVLRVNLSSRIFALYVPASLQSAKATLDGAAAAFSAAADTVVSGAITSS